MMPRSFACLLLLALVGSTYGAKISKIRGENRDMAEAILSKMRPAMELLANSKDADPEVQRTMTELLQGGIQDPLLIHKMEDILDRESSDGITSLSEALTELATDEASTREQMRFRAFRAPKETTDEEAEALDKLRASRKRGEKKGRKDVVKSVITLFKPFIHMVAEASAKDADEKKEIAKAVDDKLKSATDDKDFMEKFGGTMDGMSWGEIARIPEDLKKLYDLATAPDDPNEEDDPTLFANESTEPATEEDDKAAKEKSRLEEEANEESIPEEE